MKERLEELIKNLNGMRNEVVTFYASELEKFTPNDGNPQAAMRAGILMDLDHHITNLEIEMKRMETIALSKGAANV